MPSVTRICGFCPYGVPTNTMPRWINGTSAVRIVVSWPPWMVSRGIFSHDAKGLPGAPVARKLAPLLASLRFAQTSLTSFALRLDYPLSYGRSFKSWQFDLALVCAACEGVGQTLVHVRAPATSPFERSGATAIFVRVFFEVRTFLPGVVY